MSKMKFLFTFLLLFFTLTACTEEDKQRVQSTPPPTKIDFDFTTLNSVMVYGHVYDMIINPNNYLGKTFKIAGKFDSVFIEAIERNLYYIIINDALGCCPQGIEIELKEGLLKPEKDANIVIKAILTADSGEYPRYYLEAYSLELQQ